MSIPDNAPQLLIEELKQSIQTRSTRQVIEVFNAILRFSLLYPEKWGETEKKIVFNTIFLANYNSFLKPIKSNLFKKAVDTWTPSCEMLGSVFAEMQYNPQNINLLVDYGVRSHHTKSAPGSLLAWCLGSNFNEEFKNNMALFSPKLFNDQDGVAATAFCSAIAAGVHDWSDDSALHSLKSLADVFVFEKDHHAALQKGCHIGLAKSMYAFTPENAQKIENLFKVLQAMNWLEPSAFLQAIEVEFEDGLVEPWQRDVYCSMIERNWIETDTLPSVLASRTLPRL